MNPIHIEVSGDADSGKTLISNIIHQSLSKSGFTDVTLVDDSGETVEPYEPATILDMVQQARPDLFATPITIGETTMADDGNLGDPDLVSEIEKNLADMDLPNIS